MSRHACLAASPAGSLVAAAWALTVMHEPGVLSRRAYQGAARQKHCKARKANGGRECVAATT